MTATDLHSADLTVADLTIVDLTIVDLSPADLSPADLSTVDLSTPWSTTTLSGIALSGPALSSTRAVGGHTHLVRRVISSLLLAVVASFLVFAFVWRAEGGRWERVETPSMGTAAPVGTMLWIKPAAFDSLKVGDFITFHPPGEPGVTYSHRVYKINPDHTISTKGVLPGPDPWRLTAANVIGKVQMRWWQVGRVVQAAPLLIVGGLIVGAMLSLLRVLGKSELRMPAGVLLTSIVLCLGIAWYRPFDGATRLSFVRGHDGSAVATYVGTGVLPMRLKAIGGGSTVISSGQVGKVRVSHADAHNRLVVRLSPAVPSWFWVVLAGLCFTPAMAATIANRRRSRAAPTS